MSRLAPPAAGTLPAWAALAVASVGGVSSAVQSVVNAELGERVGNASFGAVVSTLTGSAVVVVGLAVMPSMRRGLRALPHAKLPWWTYLGGACGAAFVTIATYAVPVVGVAAFTIAQVTGGSLGGLVVDRAGLAPAGRLPLTAPRVGGALLGVGAVALAQVDRPIGDLAVDMVALGILGGAAVALQGAFNGRVSARTTNAAGTAVNFASATPTVLLAAALLGAFASGWSTRLPTEWYLYAGGPLSVVIVVCLLVSVRAVGVLRTGLSVVAGQLTGALLLDTLLPGGRHATPALLAGATLTVAAVALASARPRSARPYRPRT
ncbi:DMT family transporter [Phytohabitans sp. ZYX-F-186]|uniref:DMT family transporter n=1 Tax=Phytohabitans maris TaxID=3071409 RepID=A0ABU0ZLT4_9ACTN|nr:DMT family transporter [Phytohabitans sp. ZYX-F-186]MDQ7907999.1 DMT family transporter [Phytohabitans sp. ZYX-F-186]